jgi:gas vesicle protein
MVFIIQILTFKIINMRALTIITSTLLATTIGVVFGVLFAPQKGSKTRSKISEKNQQYTDYLSDKFDHFVDSVSHPLESIEEETKRLAKKANATAKKVAAE